MTKISLLLRTSYNKGPIDMMTLDKKYPEKVGFSGLNLHITIYKTSIIEANKKIYLRYNYQ